MQFLFCKMKGSQIFDFLPLKDYSIQVKDMFINPFVYRDAWLVKSANKH